MYIVMPIAFTNIPGCRVDYGLFIAYVDMIIANN